MYERQSCLEPPWPGPVPGLQQSCRGAPASVEALARRESCHIATDKQNAHAKRKNKGSRTVTPQNTHTRRRPRLTVISLRVMFPTLLFHPATQPAPAPLTESISSCVTRGDTRASALLPLSAAQNPTAHSAIHRITQLDIISQRPPRRRTSSSSLQSSFARKKKHTHTHTHTHLLQTVGSNCLLFCLPFLSNSKTTFSVAVWRSRRRKYPSTKKKGPFSSSLGCTRLADPFPQLGTSLSPMDYKPSTL